MNQMVVKKKNEKQSKTNHENQLKINEFRTQILRGGKWNKKENVQREINKQQNLKEKKEHTFQTKLLTELRIQISKTENNYTVLIKLNINCQTKGNTIETRLKH